MELDYKKKGGIMYLYNKYNRLGAYVLERE